MSGAPADRAQPADGEPATCREPSDQQSANGLISFVGAGPGAADLITLRGARRLADADVVIWAASLVPAALLGHCRAGVATFDSKAMTLEDVLAVYRDHPSARIVRLHSGDPSVYSAIGEQIAWCVGQERAFEIVPGVSSMAAAAAAGGHELTLPGIAQSVIMTRLPRRTRASAPAGEELRAMTAHGVSMAVFLSAGDPEGLRDALLDVRSAYGPDTPALIAYRVSWPDETVLHTTIGALPDVLRAHGFSTTVMVLVGDAVRPAAVPTRRSHVYDPAFGHQFRAAGDG